MRSRSLAAFALVVAAPFGDVSGSPPSQPILPQSRIWFTGASNIRHFTCAAGQLSGNLELRGIATRRTVLTGENASLKPSVSVSIDRLDCGIGVMNHHLHEALQGARHATIDFRLTTYEIDLTAPTPAARIAGLVTIAGVEGPVAATAIVRADTLGALHLDGRYVIRPTDFGVAPPRRFGGLLRVRDSVTVHFDVALDPGADVVDDIACRLIESANAANAKEGAHASHS
jgi:polyisoprenoid-binding protein YceI